MGLCSSQEDVVPEERARRKAEKVHSKALDKLLNSSKVKYKKEMKLLLLGAGDSGKSTLVKQMTTLYKEGFKEKERKGFYPALCNNVIISMKILCKQSLKFGQVESKNEKYKDFILGLDSNHEELIGGVGEAIKHLWDDDGIKETYSFNSRYYISDSCIYFFNKIEKIYPTYIPTVDDVYRIRIPTTGIVKNEFEFEEHIFQMFDVGGQRSERKKWIHCFDNVTSVIFVAALSGYDQVLYEDEGKNRLKESLILFAEISKMKWFTNTAFILFLNKDDLFREKIKHVPLKTYCKEYEGKDDYESASLFIKELFVATFEGQQDIFVHLTCATNTENVSKVFTAVKDIVVRKGLERAGIV